MEGTCGVFHLRVERAALSICINSQGKLRLKSLSLSRQTTLWWKFRYALGACREFLLELNAENKDAEFMMDKDTGQLLCHGMANPVKHP